MGFGIDDWVVLWTPAETSTEDCQRVARAKPGTVLVTRRLGDRPSERYSRSGGACYKDRLDMELSGKVMMMFIDFNTLVVRDGIDPKIAHREFIKIDEYRRRISPDMEGALDE